MNANSIPEEARILVIDDTLSIHEDFRKILGPGKLTPSALRSAEAKLFGPRAARRATIRFEVDCVTQGEDGLAFVERALAAERPYAVAFVDMRMPPGWDGIETLRRIWAVDPDIQAVICTAYSDRSWEEMVTQLGTKDNLLILKKPFDNIEVQQVAHALSVKWTMAQADRERLANLDACVRQRTAELLEAEGRFSEVFQANPVPTALQAIADGTYVDANPAFLQLVGLSREAVVNRTSAELQLWPEEDLWRLALESIERSAPLRSHPTHIRRTDGELREVMVSVERVRSGDRQWVLTSVEDVTERLLLEKKFQQAQKMEAVGQLAAGIAHDFNNLLTVIQSYTALVLEDPKLNADDREGLTHVRAAAARAAALTRQLLIFSRRQISRPEPVELGSVFHQMRDMLRRLVPEHIELEWHCPPGLPRVLADEANLEQVIMNLVVNARDAMPTGGRISLSAAPVMIEARPARHPEARSGRFLQLTVADTGTGMTPDVMAHIFEPFFTTKETGKGTGLGLSTVYAIVRQHAGWIEVASSPGEGTRFDLFLPTLDESDDAVAAPNADAVVEMPGVVRGERILFVEDDRTVRTATRVIASRAGYRITEAVDGVEALRVWDEAKEGFDLLLTDMVMPNGISGADLAKRLTARNPKLKVIIATGYSQDLLKQNSGAVPPGRLLLKPYSPDSLLAAIRETLDDPA